MVIQIAPRTLIEAFLPFEGEASLAELYAAANLTGLDDQPVRLAIRRLIAAGEITQQGRGRAGSLSLTDVGRRRLHWDRQGLALAFAQDAGEARWDQRWRLIAVSAPETERSVRDGLRRELLRLGAVAISTSLYLTPHDLIAALPSDTTRYTSTASTDDLCVQGQRDPLTIAETLWPQAPIVAAYRAIEDVIRRVGEDASPRIVDLLRLAEGLEHALRDDPLIPPELRSHPWVPTQVRDAWAQRWAELHEDDGATIYPGWRVAPSGPTAA